MVDVYQGDDKQIHVTLDLNPATEFNGLDGTRVVWFLTDDQAGDNVIYRRDTDASTSPDDLIDIPTLTGSEFDVELRKTDTETLEVGQTYYQWVVLTSPSGKTLTERLDPFRVNVLDGPANNV